MFQYSKCISCYWVSSRLSKITNFFSHGKLGHPIFQVMENFELYIWIIYTNILLVPCSLPFSWRHGCNKWPRIIYTAFIILLLFCEYRKSKYMIWWRFRSKLLQIHSLVSIAFTWNMRQLRRPWWQENHTRYFDVYPCILITFLWEII